MDERRRPWVRFFSALALVGALAGVAVWLDSSPAPQPGRNLFDSRPAFEAYVSRLALGALPTAAAIEKLATLDFSCETFKDGNVACLREVRGTICGERQFVDLFVPGKDGAAHVVATRFGRVCLKN